MLRFNIEKAKQIKDEHYFKVSAVCSSNSKVHYAYQKNVIKKIVEKFDIKEYDVVESKSFGDLTKHSSSGIYVLKIKKIEEKPVDILNDNVKINKSTIEVKSPKKEQIKEASPPEKTLPYGLKKTATNSKPKKKRAPRKKKTEE